MGSRLSACERGDGEAGGLLLGLLLGGAFGLVAMALESGPSMVDLYAEEAFVIRAGLCDEAVLRAAL